MNRRIFGKSVGILAAGLIPSKAFGMVKMGNKIKREYGWAMHAEDREAIDALGVDSGAIITAMKNAAPSFQLDIEPWQTLQFQGSQGACQGHALAHMAQIVFTQHTGIKRLFSRACGYYESQRHDGIRGDLGSTLSGGAKLMAEGIMLEQDWRYPARYNNRRPEGFEDAPRLRIPHTKRMRNADEVWEFLKAGGIVQTGVAWNDSFEQIRADKAKMGGGGHSTILYGFDPDDPSWAVHHNSWKGWGDNGRSYWSKNFINDCFKDRFTVFMGYQAQGLDVDQEIWSL